MDVSFKKTTLRVSIFMLILLFEIFIMRAHDFRSFALKF